MFRRKPPKTPRPAGVVRHLFHGVAIETGRYDCCGAARAIGGQRFLSDEAPLLPLEGCDRRDQCSCRYRHYSDRRTALRREVDDGLPARLVPEEKRCGTGRRITDG